MTLSPFFTASGTVFPLPRTRPVPTATTSPFVGFSFAVSGRMMPPAVLSVASRGFTTTWSARGLSFMFVSFLSSFPKSHHRRPGGAHGFLSFLVRDFAHQRFRGDE